MVLQMNNACKSLNFIIKMRAPLRKFSLLPFDDQFKRPTAIRAILTEFRTKFTLLDIKPVRTEEKSAAVSASDNDGHQLSIRSKWTSVAQQRAKFSEEFRYEAFQNTAGARIEAEQPSATQNFC